MGPEGIQQSTVGVAVVTGAARSARGSYRAPARALRQSKFVMVAKGCMNPSGERFTQSELSSTRSAFHELHEADEVIDLAQLTDR